MFDGLYFDGAVFDIGATVTDRPSVAHPTRGGWVKQAPTAPAWGPNDLGRGAAWETANIGQQAWAPNDQGRGSEWTARPKGRGFN